MNVRRMKRREHDDGEYHSHSSIDSPPREPGQEEDGEERQVEMFEEPDAMQALEDSPSERVFNVQLQLKLTPDNGKPMSHYLVSGTCRGSLVSELLTRAVASRRNKKIVEAFLDNPSEREEAAEPKKVAVNDRF